MANPDPKRRGKRGIPPETRLVSARLSFVRLERLERLARAEVPSPTLTGMIERAIAYYLADLPEPDKPAPKPKGEKTAKRAAPRRK